MIKDWGGDPPRETDVPRSETYDHKYGVPSGWKFSKVAQEVMKNGDGGKDTVEEKTER